jgi:hypothetical protein
MQCFLLSISDVSIMGGGRIQFLHLSVAVRALSDLKLDFIQRYWILLLSARLLIYTWGEL